MYAYKPIHRRNICTSIHQNERSSTVYDTIWKQFGSKKRGESVLESDERFSFVRGTLCSEMSGSGCDGSWYVYFDYYFFYLARVLIFFLLFVNKKKKTK